MLLRSNSHSSTVAEMLANAVGARPLLPPPTVLVPSSASRPAPVHRSSTLPLGQGYDWLLIDTQHGPMDREHMGIMISAVHAGGCKAFVRVGIGDRDGIQCVAPTRSTTATPSAHFLARGGGLKCGIV